MSKWILYRHTSPSGKMYIGITTKIPQQRWGKNGSGYKNCTLFYNAIQKYGWENFKHEILFTNLTEEKAKALEIDLIRHYKNLGVSYNITDGGDGALGRIPSEATRAKMRAQKVGKQLTEAHKAQLRALAEANRGVPRLEETKRKLHKANKGKKPSPQTIEALKAYNKAHPPSKERIQKMHEASKKAGYKSQIAVLNKNRKQIGLKHRKPVVQFTLEGVYVTKYNGSTFASVNTGIDASTITACCKRRNHKAGGFLWMYEKDYNKSLKENTFDNKIQEMVRAATSRNRTWSKEERKKKSEALKGIERRSERTIKLMTERSMEAISKSLLQSTLDNKPIAVYRSTKLACKAFGTTNYGTLSKGINEREGVAYGYKWKHITKDEYNQYKKQMNI